MIQGIRGSSTNAFNISFYGATLVVNYSVNGTMYEITSSSETNLATVEPSSQEVFEGGSGAVKIETDNVGDIVVEDNGTDVTDQLVVKQKITSGSLETVLGTYTLVSGGFNGQGASYFQGIVGKGVTGSTTSNNYYSNGNSTIAVFTYNLSFNDIPSNAIITRLYCQVNGHAESTSQSSEYMCAQLILGDTANTISDELNFKSIGTSNSTQTIEATTLPTVSQLSSLKLKCRLGYYGGAINGATCFIEYEVPSTGNLYYYEYALTNINADHNIVVSESIYIPPEEDPEKTYYSLTISSINATTDPKRGTTRVESGDGQTITITPSDPQITLILDNGVDVSSQLVSHGNAIPSPTVNTAPGASYGFNLNSSTGYYVSQNAGQSSSAAVARVSFNLPVRCLVTFQYINYAEATYDYGIFGNIDTALGTTSTSDSNAYRVLSNSSDNTSAAQTLTYEIDEGEHFIDIKFRKDTYKDDNNDTLQFKVLSIEPLEINNYYTYTLSNISQDHSLIFIFGDVSYYFVESSLNGDGRINPVGQMVQLQGDNYRLTIVPSNANDSVSITDNNVDVTGNLVMKQETIEKDGEQYTVTNYIYTLTNIVTGHTLSVNIQKGIVLYMKQNSSWISATKVYTKSNGRWSEVDDIEGLFSDENIYILK